MTRLQQQAKIHIKNTPFYFRVLDFFLWPFMWLLAGTKLELPQETHYWHIQKIDCNIIEKTLSSDLNIVLEGDDKSRFSMDISNFGLFHMPIFGGWKNYIILKAESFTHHWNIGWRIYSNTPVAASKCEIQKLPISSPFIKLLKGLPGQKVEFFAIDSDGSQAPLHLVGEGRLGDGKFRNVRLF